MRYFITLLIITLNSISTSAQEVCNKNLIIIRNVAVLEKSSSSFNSSVSVAIHSKTGIIKSIYNGFPPVIDTCAMQINGHGKYLIPGLTEMHGHLPYSSWAKERTQETLFLYLATGVTTVRGMLGDPVQFNLRKEINAKNLSGPNLYLAAPSLNGGTVSSPSQARELVRLYKKQGWDLLKIHPGLSRAEYMAIADEANKVGIKFGGHVPADVGLMTTLKAKQDTLDHMDGFWQYYRSDRMTCCPEYNVKKLIKETLASGTTIVPTQKLFDLLRSGGDVKKLRANFENKYMPKATVDAWARRVASLNKNAVPEAAIYRQKILKQLADGGVPIALGSDAPQVFSVPGFSIWREIKIMKQAGMTNQQILKAATNTPGNHLAYTGDKFGQIKVGYRADLILLDANPLDDIMNITKQAAVIVNGRYYSRKEIDARLLEIEKRHQ